MVELFRQQHDENTIQETEPAIFENRDQLLYHRARASRRQYKNCSDSVIQKIPIQTLAIFSPQ